MVVACGKVISREFQSTKAPGGRSRHAHFLPTTAGAGTNEVAAAAAVAQEANTRADQLDMAGQRRGGVVLADERPELELNVELGLTVAAAMEQEDTEEEAEEEAEKEDMEEKVAEQEDTEQEGKGQEDAEQEDEFSEEMEEEQVPAVWTEGMSKADVAQAFASGLGTGDSVLGDDLPDAGRVPPDQVEVATVLPTAG